jgi:hypothetical protein
MAPRSLAVGIASLILLAGSALAQAPAEPVVTPVAPPAPSADPAPEPPKAPTNTGGYSWQDAPRKPASKAKPKARFKVKFDRTAPHATFPGFRMLSDGSSVVWVVLDRRVEVVVTRAQGRVSYLMRGAQVSIRNNTHALVTTHFNTPMSRTRLLPVAGGAELVVELREAVEPTHEIVQGPRGMMVLRVRLPRASRTYATASDPGDGNLRVGGALPPKP